MNARGIAIALGQSRALCARTHAHVATAKGRVAKNRRWIRVELDRTTSRKRLLSIHDKLATGRLPSERPATIVFGVPTGTAPCAACEGRIMWQQVAITIPVGCRRM